MAVMLWAVLILFAAYLVVVFMIGRLSLKGLRTPIFLSPEQLGLRTEDVEFQSEGNTLRGWWVHSPEPRGVCVLLHGYIMSRAENAALAAEMYRLGWSSLLFDFRACGMSGGKRCGIGWLERRDVLAACSVAKARYPGLPILLIGSSMGAAAAAFALQEDPAAADALILDGCYTRLPSATLGWWRFLLGRRAGYLLAPAVLVAWPVAGFNPFRADVGTALTSHDKPVLILHGADDLLVRPGHARTNFAKAQKPGRIARLRLFDNCNHAEPRWIRAREFMAEIETFLDEVGIAGERL